MRYVEVTTFVLKPNKTSLDLIESVLEDALPVFDNWLMAYWDEDHPHRIPIPDPEVLADVLNQASPNELGWSVLPDTPNCVAPFIKEAKASPAGVQIGLDAAYIEENWNSDLFKRAVIRVMEHELIHLEQYSRMNPLHLLTRKSGWQKAQKPDGSIDFKIYLSDPDEIMAHANDLANEMSMADDPKFVLGDPEGFIEFLPTWKAYRKAGFLRSDPVIRKLLKYTYLYMKEKGLI